MQTTSGAAVVIVVLSLLTACSLPNAPEPSRAQPVRAVCPQHPTGDSDFPDGDFYFPEGTLGSNARADEIFRAQFSRILSVMNAPSLSCGSQADAYRITQINAFRGPMVVTVSASGNSWTLQSVVFRADGLMQGPPFQVTQKIERPLSKGESADLSATLNAVHFWNMLPTGPPSQDNDGDISVIEGRVQSTYHAVNQDTLDTGFRELAHVLYSFARVKLR